MPTIRIDFLVPAEEYTAATDSIRDAIIATYQRKGIDPGDVNAQFVSEFTGEKRDPELLAQWSRENLADGDVLGANVPPEVLQEWDAPQGAWVEWPVKAGEISVNSVAMAMGAVLNEQAPEPKDPLARRVLDAPATMRYIWRVGIRP